MECFCLGRASFEAAIRKGDIAGALAHLKDDPLVTACTHFRNGNTLWHLVAGSGHLLLLQGLAERLSAVWPSPDLPVASEQQQHGPFLRRSNPFQCISDGLRGRVPDTSHKPLAAFVNTPNLLGQTALMTACKRGHTGCVQFLLSMGANPWYRDRANCTALHYATLHDQGPCIEAILQHPAGARAPPGTRQSLVRLVDLPNCSGYTAAHFATIANKPRALAALLAGGANIAARCWSESSDWISGPPGSTPLHLAARRGDTVLCKMIMSHYLEVLRDSGAPDPRLHTDTRGLRPYHRAADRGFRELAELLMPSTPLSYVFGPEVAPLYKVPKLKALASAALKEAFFTQINASEAAAAERRRLATHAAVAAARAAASGSKTAADAGGAANTAAAGGIASGTADARPLSRASSLINDTLQFVRRQSLRPLDSLRRRLFGSGKWQIRESSQELKLTLHNLNNLDACAEMTAGALAGYSDYSGAGVGVGGTRMISSASGIHAHTAAMALLSGLPRALPLDGMPSIDAAKGGTVPAIEFELREGSLSAAAAADVVAPLLGVGSERSALLDPAAATGRRNASLTGGISPVRGNSFDSDQVPFSPSTASPPLCQGLGMGSSGRKMVVPPPSSALKHSAGLTACNMGRGTNPEDPNTESWAVLPHSVRNSSSFVGINAGGIAGGSAAGVPSRGMLGFPSYRIASLATDTSSPVHLPPLRPQLTSPFALSSLQMAPLDWYLGTPVGGSPTYSIDGGSGDCPSGWSPPLPTIMSMPAGGLGLDTVREDNPADEKVGNGGNSLREERLCIQDRVSQASQLPLGADGAVSAGEGGGLQAMDSFRSSHSSPSFAIAPATMASSVVVVGNHNTECKGERVAAGSSGDPASGNLQSEALQLPNALGCEGYGSGVVNTCKACGSGCTATPSRAGSGKLRISAASGTVSGTVAVAIPGAATRTIGSDASENYCGVCFERPACIHIKPCQHLLCAECSREVIRMMEMQPPPCPFCRRVVHGFSC